MFKSYVLSVGHAAEDHEGLEEGAQASPFSADTRFVEVRDSPECDI